MSLFFDFHGVESILKIILKYRLITCIHELSLQSQFLHIYVSTLHLVSSLEIYYLFMKKVFESVELKLFQNKR